MSWGSELWDQYDNISSHTSKGIDFLDKYGSFIKERCAIEIEYASKLRRLVKNHQFKKKDETDGQYSYVRAFIIMLQEITDLAGQHELIAENMCSDISNEINTLVKELKDERKRYLNEGQKLQFSLHQSYVQLDKSKKYYEKAFKEAERAIEHYEKVDADYNLSRAEVEKARQYSLAKNQLADQCKSDYATNLQKTNELQRIHFTEAMPRVFNQLQELEQRRIVCSQSFIHQSAQIQINVFPIINKCLQGIISASEVIDPNADCNLVIEKYKSGNEPPEDLPFEDLSNPSSTDGQSTNSGSSHPLNYSSSITGKDTIKGTLSYAKLKKRAGIFGFFQSNKPNSDDLKEEIYADLPPVQRRKRITEKLNSIQDQIKQEKNVRDGLMKMKIAYQDNPALGDASTLDSQILENGKKLEKLQAEYSKFECFLNEITTKKPNTSSSTINNNNNNNNSVNHNKSPSASRKNRNSLSEESLSRSASDSSVSQQHYNATGNSNGLGGGAKSIAKETAHAMTLSPQNLKVNHVPMSSASSATDTEREETPIYSSENETDKVDNSNVEYIDSEPRDMEQYEYEENYDPLGTARALYDFKPDSEGSISMQEDETFDVIELDQGDGWTKVRRENLEEGFVPTSYLEINLGN